MTDNGKTPAVTKGIGFVGIFKFIKIQPEGEKLLAEIRSAVSPAAAAVISRPIIAVRSYPYEVFAELLRTVDRVVGFGDLSLCEDIGEYAANRDYEYFFGPNKGKLKPADLFRDCNIYWKSYYQDAGSMKTEDPSPEHTVVRIYDFPDMDPAHCRLMVGWMAQSMRNAGAVWIDYLSETQSARRGGPCHEFQGRWRLLKAGEILPEKNFQARKTKARPMAR